MLNSKAYLEDYHYIKLLVHESEMHLVDCDNLFLSNKRDNIKLYVYKTSIEKRFQKKCRFISQDNLYAITFEYLPFEN